MAITEERIEMMVASPTNPHPVLRKAHFLVPTVTSIHAAIAPPPSATAIAEANSFTFLGWKAPKDNWKTWVDQMHALHHPTWRRAGILDAVLASKCHIIKNQDLLFQFVKNYWCPATNTFVFPWGEATVTLEDVMVLGGYSVLGQPVFSPDPDGATHEVVEKLNHAHSMISNSTTTNPCHDGWITIFQGSGSEIEHEAFLAYWLSCFVFPFSRDQLIGRTVLPIAASLARGTRIALAPTVLAGIYHNMTSLKMALVNASDDPFEFLVTAPLLLVQAWVWERFQFLSPMPISIGQHEPRLARWHEVEKGYTPDYERIESGEEFEWRPYMSKAPSYGVPQELYGENGYWAIAEGSEDLEGLVRCLRTSDLVSFEVDSIESYQPHRVAMQFGLDQDLPGHVMRVSILRAETAWSHYNRPSEGATVYVPPRLYKGCVTERYFGWWREMSSGGERSGTRGLFGRMFELHPPPPGFSLKLKTVTFHEEVPSPGVRIRGFIESSSQGKSEDHGDVSAPPGTSSTPSPQRTSRSGDGVGKQS